MVLGAEPTLPLPLPLLCVGSSKEVPLQDQLCMPPALGVGDSALVVYSDGSLQQSGSPGCQGGAGFVVLEGDKPLWEVAVKLGGWMSSTKMEVYACMAALTVLPVSRPVQIFTDSQGLIAGFQSFVTGSQLHPFRRLLRNRFYREWSALRQMALCRSAPVTLVKVDAHTGNFGNDLADCIAKQGAVGGLQWAPSFSNLPDFQFLPNHGGHYSIEGDLRAYLKLQSQLRISVTWKYRERVQQSIPYFECVDWDSTILNVHQGNLPGCLVTSMSMCSACAYHVKALHSMLPTATRLLVTRPDLYLDDLCPRCLQEPETADHLWQCQCSQAAMAKIKDEGTSLFWSLAIVAWPGLRLARSSGIFPGPHTAVDVVRGIVPLEWVTLLCVGGLSLVKARSVAGRVGRFMVTAAFKEIWCPCCDVQVEHEHSRLITQSAKVCGRRCAVQHAYCAQSRPHHTHVSQVLAGFCGSCQLSFADHPLGACSPLVAQSPFLADKLLQMHHMSLCKLPSILDPCVNIRALDSTDRGGTGS